jgi:uncharacterized membrane protein
VQLTLLAGVSVSSLCFLAGFILQVAGAGAARDVMRAGLLLLLLTPAARVAMLIYGYCRTKEYLFAAAASAVLALLTASALGLTGF